MALKDIFKVSRKTFVNPTAWIGAREIETNSKALWGIIKDAIARPVQGKEESFNEAMQRLGLSETDVQNTITAYRRVSYLLLTCGLVVFFYSFFLLFSHHVIFGFFLGLATSALFLAQAFKYHFWSFQMKRRELGASFAEWKRSVLGD